MASSQTVRIFISSPGDVAEERDKARTVIHELEQKYLRDVTLQPVLWEDLALPATASFQETIDYLIHQEPVDIAVFILWSRLGSPLGPAVRRADGSPYRSGTEREFDLMLTAFQQSGGQRPFILAYTRQDDLGFKQLIARSERHQFDELNAQMKLAESFIQEQFRDQEGRNLRAFHVYSEPVSFAQRLKTHLKQALEELVGTDAAPRWLDEPYRGLRHFDLSHAPIFRGREAETDALLERLDAQHAAGCAFVVILGASGSGKSSLARAGVAAALTQRVWDERVKHWRIAAFTPGLAADTGSPPVGWASPTTTLPTNAPPATPLPSASSPAPSPAGFLIRSLIDHLAAQVPELTSGIHPADLAAGLERDPGMTVRLSIAPAFARAADQAQGAVRVLLILDQMEELWTDRRITADDRTRFLNAIDGLARSGHVAVLATLRSDFYASAQSEPVFLKMKGERGHFDLLPPDAAALRRLITEPARLAGLQFEQDTSGRSLDEVLLESAVRDVSRDPGALPLLQYALSELDAQRDPSRRMLTFAAWEALGRIDGALGRRAEAVFQELPAGAQAALTDLLPRLITVDTTGRQSAVRRRTALSELTATADARTLTTRLIDARFLTADTERAADTADAPAGPGMVSLAHEALLRGWPRIADWVQANAEALRLRARVELSQQRWEQKQRDVSLLLTPGLPLEEGRQLLSTARPLLHEGTVRYVQASLDHQAEQSRRARRRRQTVLTTLTLLTLLATCGGLVAWWKQQEANTQRNLATTRAGQLQEKTTELEEKGIALQAQTTEAQAQTRKATAATDRAEAALARTNYFLADARWKENRLDEAFELLEKVPERHRNFEWYLSRRQFEGSDMTLYGHQGQVTSVAWSPDRHRIASASWDTTIKVWDAATGAELRTLSGHSGWVTSVAFSPDGTRLASASWDRTIKVWDAATGAELRTLSGHSNIVTSVAFSPDGTRLASASYDKTIKVWDAATGAELRTLSGHSELVRSVAFSPDGTRLASGSWDKTIKVWDAATGAELRTLSGHSNIVTSVAFSPDGTRLASASYDKTIKVWDAATGAELRTLSGHSNDVTSVAFSPDGTRLASGSWDKTIKVWDAATGAELRTLSGHSNDVTSVAFSPDGTRLASASADNTIKVWDAATGAELRTLTGHQRAVTSVAFSPDGTRLASASADNTIKVWDAATGAELRTLSGHSETVTSVAFSPDGTRLASASWDNTIKVWDAATGAELRTLTGHSELVTSVAFSPDGTRLASASGDGTIRVWEVASRVELLSFRGHTASVNSVAFNTDGTCLASASLDQTVKLWDTSTGAELRTLTGHSQGVTSVAFSPDGTRLVSATGWTHTSSFSAPGGQTVKLWDANTGAELRTLAGHSEGVSSVAFSPDGTRLASASYDKTIKVWDAATGAELRTLSGHSNVVTSVAFSPDGTRLASASHDKTIKVWDAATGAELRTLSGHSEGVNSVAFSPDGTRLASASHDKTIKVWDAATGAELRTLSGHSELVRSVAFSPDGTRLASASWDRTIKVWDAATGAELRTLSGHSGWVTSVAFSPDGTRLASASDDKTIKVWDAATGAELRTLSGHSEGVNSVAFSPDGTRLASASDDKTIKVWDAATGAELQTLTGHSEAVTSVAFSPDGTRLFSEDGSGKRLAWDVRTGEPAPLPEVWPNEESRRQRTPDGRWLAVASDKYVRLVDLEFQNTPREKARREHKARIDPWHHDELARAAEDRAVALEQQLIRPDVPVNDADNFNLDLPAVPALKPAPEPRLPDADAALFNPQPKAQASFATPAPNTPAARQGEFSVAALRDSAPSRLRASALSETPSEAQSESHLENASAFGCGSNDDEIPEAERDDSDCQTPSPQVPVYEEAEAPARPKPFLPAEQVPAEARRTLLDLWYAAMFHRAWMLIVRPDDGDAHDRLHAAYQRWQALRAADLKARNETPSAGERFILPPVIRQTLKLPRGTAPALRP